MALEYPHGHELARILSEKESNSLDFIVLVSGALDTSDTRNIETYLNDCVRVLRPGGLLFVQGSPEYLPELGVFLDSELHFKYWIAIKSEERTRMAGLPSTHAAVMLFTKGNGRFNVKHTRFPHQKCEFCGRSLRDWGGKTHLMHPDGYVVSDVWTDLPPADNHHQLSKPVLDTILRMMDFHDPNGLIGPKAEQSAEFVQGRLALEFGERGKAYGSVNELEEDRVNIIYCDDALKVLSHYPDNSIDLAFADPPYNLNKGYNTYEDGSDEAQYIEWCNAWLAEYARVLKPTGSLYVLNLPRWSMHHAAFLNKHLYFQNWIVWDALSEPRGKIMPAHYGLLFYTKHPTDFTFNYEQVEQIDAHYYCLRASCIRKRKEHGADDKERLDDIWSDVHRIKHKRDRDYHPCQLPDSLIERIILLSSNQGDIVLDALCGVGTTPVVAAKLKRRYIGIDLDESYVAITREKIKDIEITGRVARTSIRKAQPEFTKKELQLELRDIAIRLGRLPTPEDVSRMSGYGLEAFLKAFPTWSKALQAAKIEVRR